MSKTARPSAAENTFRRVEIAGVVEVHAGGLCDRGPRIGEVDVVGALEHAWPYPAGGRAPNVKVWLGVEPVKTGPLWAIHGFWGTDATPPELPEITVGDYDLIERLTELDGREVVLIVEAA